MLMRVLGRAAELLVVAESEAVVVVIWDGRGLLAVTKREHAVIVCGVKPLRRRLYTIHATEDRVFSSAPCEALLNLVQLV